MTEKLDRDIRRALQAEVKDLTFTPEMRRRVLERIQAEAGAPDQPAVKTGRSPRSLAVPRPVLWAAVAAAALIIAFRLDLGGAGGHRTAMDSGASKPEAAASAQIQAQAAPADSSSSSTADTKATPPTTPAPPDTGQGSQAAAVNNMAPNGASAKKEVRVLHLAAATAAAQAAQPAPLPEGVRGMAAFATVRPTIRLAIQPAKDHVVELNTDGLRAVLPDGSELWSAPIPELSPEARLMPAPGGHYAVLSGSTVSIISAEGALEQSITLADAVTDLAFSPDSRVALASATQVEVRKGDAAQFQVATGSPAYVAFAPNGTLAILSVREGQTHLALRDAAGQHPVDAAAPAEAHVLAVAGDNLLLAGSQAYDLSGSPLWSLPFNPQGISRVGDRVIAWDQAHAVCVDAAGSLQWQTAFDTEGLSILKVVPGPDAQSLQILGATPAGGTVWLVAPTGESLGAEATAVPPADATLLGGKLVILTQDSLTFVK